ncbi:Probable lipoprotein precursor [Flavobacterium indicum GPTSA100-9 = DSM 17447]|uniref:Probable lipoprotein n=1 Tax=Flavobacterium indicum (strain DSM 17447 / CIP 109464 / GPTSA100-9) TaxID=1094466 RepID=H8XPZ3_FLAIG|nr:hypothetical protein [Flavobacterium indicum]CCG54209.1 Probable lipoprotein precursor [Flavobacterium indicum GPTSA100-9 = DSM 17447]
MRKKIIQKVLPTLLIGALVVSCVVENGKLPQNVKPLCDLSENEMASWFKSGTITENGMVTPANSVDFIHKTNCDFYKWSERMFLWMTSKEQGGKTVFESPEFYTVSPKVNGQRNLIPHRPNQLLKAVANVDKTGKIISEEGQATDDVLMDVNGNLVYYISMVNDVYAEFLNAVHQKKMSGKQFPTTKEERDSIFSFAQHNGVKLKNPSALAMEIKTSWVVAESLKNVEDFVTIEATIPVYKKQSNQLWLIQGERKVKLALVGMHIVGSANGHPEMIWATFEHKRNTPNQAYQYLTKDGTIETVLEDGNNDWLFNSEPRAINNQSHMTFSGDSIIAKDLCEITPSNTLRTKPWGSAVDVKPNAEDATPAASNSEIIAINNSVISKLKGKDVRKNYIFIGATWTENGAGPNGYSYNPTVDSLKVAGVAIGASQLANSTMETYAQNGDKYNTFGSCFSCHSNNKGLKPDDLSHVYNGLMKGLPQQPSLAIIDRKKQ